MRDQKHGISRAKPAIICKLQVETCATKFDWKETARKGNFDLSVFTAGQWVQIPDERANEA
jgi:hypothetical protein